MCYTAAKKIAEGLALPAFNEEGLPRGLPRLVATLPPRGHGWSEPIVEPVQLPPGRARWLAAIMAFNAQPGPGRRAIPAVFLQALQQQQIGRSPN